MKSTQLMVRTGLERDRFKEAETRIGFFDA